MGKLKPVAVLVAAVAAGLAVSGCYAFSGVTLNKSALNVGKTSTATVKAYSANGTMDRDVFFILLGLPDNATSGDTSDDPLNATRGKFDTKKTIYRRPKALAPNADIRDALVADGSCGAFEFVDAPTSRFVVLATANRVRQTVARKQVSSRYVLRQVRQASAVINPQPLLTAVGFWEDSNSNGQVDQGGFFPEASCGGGAIHNINVKIQSTTRPATEAQLRAEYGE
jgi:hypothetical protein